MRSTLDYAVIAADHQAVEQFIERLAVFSLDQWLSVAASATHDANARTSASATLDQLVAQHGFAVDAWSVADDVETAFHYSVGAMRCPPPRSASAPLRVARQTASTAALALLLRPLLGEGQFESLYQPFASLVELPVEPLRPIRLVGDDRMSGKPVPARSRDSFRKPLFSQPFSQPSSPRRRS